MGYVVWFHPWCFDIHKCTTKQSRRVALPEDAKENIVTLLKTLNAFLEDKDTDFKYRIRSLRVNDKDVCPPDISCK